MSTSQSTSKHGKKAHQNECNDGQGKDPKILKKGYSPLAQKMNGQFISSPKNIHQDKIK